MSRMVAGRGHESIVFAAIMEKTGQKKYLPAIFNGQTIRQFYCAECGMRYQRFRPWQTFDENAGHAVKLDYGHLWYD